MHNQRGRKPQAGREVWRSTGHTGNARVRRTGGSHTAKRKKAALRKRRRVMAFALLITLFVGGLALGSLLNHFRGKNMVSGATLAGGYVVPTVAADGRHVLVLDAGHGGHDTGTTNAAKTIYEADINLAMVGRVAAYMAAHEDEVQVVLTREDATTYLTPKQRAEIANAVNADLLLSLHLNADEYSPNVRGFQVFAQPSTLAGHSGSLGIASLLVENVKPLGLPIIGDTGMYYMFYRTESDKQGYDISWPVPEWELENDTYGVLQCANCPAILVEQWYLTNSDDMNQMYNDSGMNAMALAIYHSICEYYGLTPDA